MSPLPFVGADELRAATPAEPAWTWDGFLAPGNVTLLAKKPKVGGSTLAVAVAEAIATSAPKFLGRSISGGPVVYVSEESAATLIHKLPAINSLRILTRDATWPKPSWAELVAGSCEEARRVGAVALVIDTWPYWTALAKDAKKVLLALHGRKGGGADGEAVRDSGAIAGAADIVLELEHAQRPTERVLLALSRYPSTPGSLVFSFDKAMRSWSVVGEGERTDARAMHDRLAIVEALRDGLLTRAELQEAIGAPERQWHAQLDELLRDGQVIRTGAGRKGSPYRFEIVRENAAQEVAQKPRRNAVVERSDSAAHPFRDAAETNHDAAGTNCAPCAASDLEELPDDYDGAYLDALIAEQPGAVS